MHAGRAAGAATIYLALAVLVFASAWQHPQSVVLGVGGDPLLSMWFLNWTPFALSHGLNPFLTDYLDYPQGVNLMWNTASPLLGLLLWPVTGAFGPVLAFNLAETLGVAASAFAAFLALHRFVRSYRAALLGGLLYGFSPFMMSHALGHPQLTAAITPPLMLVVLDEILVRQRHPYWVAGLLLGLLGAIQLYIWEELCASEVLVGALGIALLAALNRDQVRGHARHAAKAFGVAVGVFILLAGVPLAIQFLGPQQVHGSAWGVNRFVSDLLAFITPTPVQAIAPPSARALSRLFPAQVYEWSSYLGPPLLALLVYAAVRGWQSPLTRVAALTGAFTALLSMGAMVSLAGRTTLIPVAVFAFAFPLMVRRAATHRLLVYAFLAAWAGLALLPVVHNILPSRLTVFMYLMAATMVALFLDHELEEGSRRRTAVATGLVVLALVPLVPHLPYPVTPVQTPAFFRSAELQQIRPGSVALVTPYAYDWRVADPMSWQVAAGMRFRMPNGFAWVPGPSRFPPHTALGDALAAVALGRAAPALSEERRGDMLADLRTWQVETVIVGRMAHQEEMVAFFSDLLNSRPDQVGEVFRWRIAPEGSQATVPQN